jgi:hypothetical protein
MVGHTRLEDCLSSQAVAEIENRRDALSSSPGADMRDLA